MLLLKHGFHNKSQQITLRRSCKCQEKTSASEHGQRQATETSPCVTHIPPRPRRPLSIPQGVYSQAPLKKDGVRVLSKASKEAVTGTTEAIAEMLQ